MLTYGLLLKRLKMGACIPFPGKTEDDDRRIRQIATGLSLYARCPVTVTKQYGRNFLSLGRGGNPGQS